MAKATNRSTGTPSSKTARSARGLPSASTLAGPPERTTPRARKARMASAGMVQGWISQ